MYIILPRVNACRRELNGVGLEETERTLQIDGATTVVVLGLGWHLPATRFNR